MSSIIAKKEEYILTRAQFEKLKKDNKLVIGSVYKIKDDPTVQDLIDGIQTSKKAERDSNGNIIEYTYRRIDDSYSITDIDNQFISKLANYYTKQETYTKSEVDILLNAIPKFGVQVITELPTTNISTTIIYLLAQEAKGSDYYDEYMYINNQWELIGSTRIDLSNYYTIAQVEEKLTTKVSITDEANQIYGTNAIGEPDTYTISNNASVDTIAKRTSTGTLKINDATEINEAASYGQLQSLLIDETNARSQADTEIRALIPTKVSQLSNDSNYVIDSALAPVAKTGSYTDLLNKPDLNEIESRLTTLENSTPEIDADGLATQEALNNVINNTTQIVGSKSNFMAGGAKEANGTGCISIGYNADTGFGGWSDGIAIGRNTIAYGGYDIAIGYNSGVTYSGASNAIAIGRNAKADESNVIQLGTGQNSTENTLQIYDDNIYNWNDHTLDVQNLNQNGNPVFGTLTDTVTPDAQLHGETGQFYLNTDEKKLYICTAVDLNDETGERLHNWQEVGGNSNDTLSYSNLENKPSINGVELVGNKTGEELGLANKTDIPVIPTKVSEFENDTDFATKTEVENAVKDKASQESLTALDTRVTELENAEPPEIDTSTLVSLEAFNKVINNETVLQRRSNGSFYLGTNLTSISDAAKNNTIIGNNSLDRNILPINTVYIGSATNGAKGSNAVIIGANAWCNADNNIVIGNNANVISGNYLIQLGDGKNSTSYTLQIFDDNIYNWNTHTLTVQNIQLNGTDINTIISNAIPTNLATETYVDTKIAALVDSAPETLDTLAEVATAIQENETIVESLNSAIGNKANQADLTALDTRLTAEENKQLKTFTLYQSSAVNVSTDEYDKVSVGNVILNVKYDGSTTQETYNLAHIDNVRELGNAHNKLVDRVVTLETDMPTKMSDLTNDTEYVTKAEMEAAITEAIKNLVTAEQLEAAITNNITDTLNTEV